MADQLREADQSSASPHARLLTEIQLYERQAQEWEGKGKKILRRFKDDRSPREENLSRYNILWSNIQTLLPALYAKNPKPNIERRFKDNDALSRITSEVLERATDYFINSDKFSMCMKQSVLDRLLPGRGTAWARYVPHFKDMEVAGPAEEEDEGPEISDEIETDDETPIEGEESPQEVDYEEVACDYVHWQDFGHNIGARTWDEVYMGWRRVYLTKEELIERFGKNKAMLIPLDYTPKGLNDEKISTDLKKASIYEIWDKQKKCVYWLHKSMSTILDEKDDPLRLPEFYPFPRPLLATTANDTLIPVPDYKEYQDQAIELDDLTSRIAAIKKALKLCGVYDSSAQGIERLLAEGVENQLVPVDQWAIFAEKGGISGVMDFFPLKEVAEALLALTQAREQTKQDLYEITGMSDIMRGATDPNETASAQTIKGQYSNLRLHSSQDEVQRFARDMVRIIAQIIAEHFSLETIKEISGMKLLTGMEKQQLQMKMQMMQQPQPIMGQAPALPGQQSGSPPGNGHSPAPPMAQPQPGQPNQSPQPPPPTMGGQDAPPPPLAPPPIPEEIQEQLDNPTWEEVYALLKNDAMRSFRIDIETDSTIKADEDQEKADRVQFLTAAGTFLDSAMKVAAQEPELTPLLGEMLRFGVQAFRVSKPLEGAFNVAIAAMEKKASAGAGQPKPNPEQMKIQADQAADQARLQADQAASAAKLKADQESNASQLQADKEKMILEMQFKKEELQMEYAFKMQELQQNKQMEDDKTESEMQKQRMAQGVSKDGPALSDSLTNLANSMMAGTQAAQAHHKEMQQHLANHSQQIADLTKLVAAPKKLIRDNQGRAIGTATMQ